MIYRLILAKSFDKSIIVFRNFFLYNKSNYKGGYYETNFEFRGGGFEPRIAFTLAEVLITLGIIGVVAALTVPNIISKYRKQLTLSQLKSAYSLLSNAYKLSVANNGDWLKERYESAYSVSVSKQDFDKYFRPNLGVIKDCKKLTECGYDSDSPFKSIHTKEPVEFVVIDGHRYYMLKNGMTLFYRDKPGDGGKFAELFLSVDLNGPKKPNILGVDLFYFAIAPEGDFSTVVPRLFTWEYSQVNEECIKGYYGGTGCTAKIIRDGWQIKDDYPYKF